MFCTVGGKESSLYTSQIQDLPIGLLSRTFLMSFHPCQKVVGIRRPLDICRTRLAVCFATSLQALRSLRRGRRRNVVDDIMDRETTTGPSKLIEGRTSRSLRRELVG